VPFKPSCSKMAKTVSSSNTTLDLDVFEKLKVLLWDRDKDMWRDIHISWLHWRDWFISILIYIPKMENVLMAIGAVDRKTILRTGGGAGIKGGGNKEI
jgi:hypothetical protein